MLLLSRGIEAESGAACGFSEKPRKGSKGGDVLALGQAEPGKLLARLTAADAHERMPPEGAPLKPEEIKAIREWIAAGAAGRNS